MSFPRRENSLFYGFSRKMEGKRKEFLFLWVWFVVIFLFFSISKGKRGIYLLPLFPAVSLMVGKLWDDFISISMEHFHHGWISFPLHLFMGLVLIAGAAIPWVVSARFSSWSGRSASCWGRSGWAGKDAGNRHSRRNRSMASFSVVSNIEQPFSFFSSGWWQVGSFIHWELFFL